MHACNLSYRLPSGAEYLFIARDEGDVHSWVTAINAAIHNPAAAVTRGEYGSH